jgi:hypothetical protein
MEDGGSSVIAVDLIEVALPIFLDDGFADDEFFQDDTAAWTVDAGEAGDDACLGEDEVFGGAKDVAGFAIRLSGAFLGHCGAIGLGIDRGAGGEEQRDAGEDAEQVTAAIEIDRAVGIWTAATGRGAVDDEVRLDGEGGDGGGRGEIAEQLSEVRRVEWPR